jgi:cytoskeletal protein RodZ
MTSDAGEKWDEPIVVAESAASQMRAAREKAGMSLADVAAQTRVPLRHLEALEKGDFGALPGITYCAGFARAFARAVNMDEVALVAKVRQEIEEGGDFGGSSFHFEEAVDPARVPPRTLAWVAAVIAMLIAGGYGIWRMQQNAPPSDEQPVAEAPAAPVAKPVVHAPAPAPVQGPVVLAATDDIWMRVYEKDGRILFQGMLKKGESFSIPADAQNPLLLTGRPDALAVTVGGKPVAPLGTAKKSIHDFPVSGPALLARPAEAAPQGQAAPAVPGAPAAGPVSVTPHPAQPAPVTQAPAAAAPRPHAAVPATATPAAPAPAAPATPPAAPATETPPPAQ